jgi:hypothetical protein
MSHPSSIPLKLPAGLARVLDGVRRRNLAFSMAEFPICLLAAIATAWSLQGIADRVFDLSWTARCVLLALDFAGALWLICRFVVRPLTKRLDRKAAALLVERRIPEFRSSLISAVELSQTSADLLPQSRLLAERLLDDTAALALQLDVIARALPPGPLKKLAMRMSWPVLAAGLLLLAARPASGLLLKRILLSHEAFPARTNVISITGNLLVDAGSDATLAARAMGEIPIAGKLIVTRPGQAPEVLPVAPATPGGDTFCQVVRNIREPFTYRFELNAGVGSGHAMSVRYPPVVTNLRFTQLYPAYTGLPETVISPTALNLLEGSTLRIDGSASKALRSGGVRIRGTKESIALALSGDGNTVFRADLTVPSTGWKSLSIHLVGSENDISLNDPEYPIRIERDKPPAINLTVPKSETIGVLTNAKVPVSFELVDDHGFSSIGMSYQVFRPLPDGTTEQAGSGTIPFEAPEGSRSWKRDFDWNLARLLPAVPVGSCIIFWIEVADNNGGTAGPSVVRSPEKTIRIVSGEQKRLELLERMGEKAAEIERLYERQRSISDRIESAIE